jgi:hypothetical protein
VFNKVLTISWNAVVLGHGKYMARAKCMGIISIKGRLQVKLFDSLGNSESMCKHIMAIEEGRCTHE